MDFRVREGTGVHHLAKESKVISRRIHPAVHVLPMTCEVRRVGMGRYEIDGKMVLLAILKEVFNPNRMPGQVRKIGPGTLLRPLKNFRSEIKIAGCRASHAQL